MAKFTCFGLSYCRKKKEKGDEKSSGTPLPSNGGIQTLQAKTLAVKDPNLSSINIIVPFGVKGNFKCMGKVMSLESPVSGNALEAAYEGEDEREECSSMKKEFSGSDHHVHVDNSGEEESHLCSKLKETAKTRVMKDAETSIDLTQSGHISDPGIGKPEFWASPKLTRSCSNLETSAVLQKIAHQLPISKSQSFEELQALAGKMKPGMTLRNPGSPGSVMTHCSADRVMLKKHSSSQVLPSKSRRLWWKLFLWSHRNLHRPTKKSHLLTISQDCNQQGGYCSDTLEPTGQLESTDSFNGASRNEDSSNGFHGGSYGQWPQNQWVAFSSESSSFSRVEEWVKELEVSPPLLPDNVNNNNDGASFPPSPESGRSPARNMAHSVWPHNIILSEEVSHANSIVQSLNSSSTVAHIAGIGLKVIPAISGFTSLRSVNLSNNLIVHITPGSLPKGLHTLSLSRNKISTIEGLRELTRLRILDLSYNRISRIGHGLSNCTLIKELYLAGNKIGDVEGLHRLLKLTVLDLSFNKITTTKALGQLVANYNSLLALNLLGNPIQSNMGDDQLRKALCSLLPKLSYLNKQPIKPQRARELLTDNVAKAALGNGAGWSSRKRTAKRGSHVVHRGSLATAERSRGRSKSQSRHRSSTLKLSSSAIPSSSH